jgi:hypothetical protein
MEINDDKHFEVSEITYEDVVVDAERILRISNEPRWKRFAIKALQFCIEANCSVVGVSSEIIPPKG